MLLIKHGTIVDGSGKPGFKKDILISGDRIAAMGDFSGKKNIETIDALGCVVAPGFIDLQSEIDHRLALFQNPGQETYLKEGVTSVIGGHCGASLAPLINGSLIAMRKWADIDQINVDWASMNELRARLTSRRLGINFGTLVGYNTIRRALTYDAIRDLTDRELEMAKRTLSVALQEGAIGVSTGLGYMHGNEISAHEICAIVALVAKKGGVYTTHLRDEYLGLRRALQETIDVAERTGVTTIVSHFAAQKGDEAVMREAIATLNALPKKTKLYVACSADTKSILPIYFLLPQGARQGNLEQMCATLEDHKNRERVMRVLNIRRPDRITIVEAQRHQYLVGKTLEAIAKNRGEAAAQTLLDIVQLTKGKALVAQENGNVLMQDELLENAHALPTMPFAAYRAQQTKKQRAIETTIAKITGIPAEIARIKKRGLIKEGYCADVTIMQNDAVRDVIVNGVRAVQSGNVTTKTAGVII